MSKNKIYVLAILLIIGFALLVPSRTASAETRVSQSLSNNVIERYNEQVWKKENSPYILESDVYVNGSLIIQPGVEVYGAESQNGSLDINIIVGNGAKLDIQGNREERVKINNLNTIQVTYGSSADIKNTDFSKIRANIYFYKAKANIATSTIRNSGTAIKITDSTVNIWGSRIENNTYGVRVIGNFIYSNPSATNTRMNISNSVLSNQLSYSLKNDSTEYINVKNNWWGNENGPVRAYSYTSSTTGYIVPSKLNLYDPWLTSEPEFDPEPVVTEPVCCSNVLFIPGLKATRLYKDEASNTNRLWDPTQNDDVRKLYLNESGESLDDEIYSGSQIDSVLGLKDIYGNFMEYLDELKSTGTIKEWKYFGYDWRMPIDRLVAGDWSAQGGDESLLGLVKNLAENSPTGKVSIIAHSNGGLVTKYLVKTLQEIGQENLIDKVVSVAVPYLGTPKALLGILHGYDESIALGLLVKESTARGLGRNMSSAYALLPSLEYFKKVFTPTIAFASTTVAEINDGEYPTEIANHVEQNKFLEDTFGTREEPDMSDTTRPIKGNIFLGAMAKYIHGILDPFVWPAHIARYAIVGWGEDTPSGVVYGNKKECSGFLWSRECRDVPDYRAVTTVSGDGTVVSPSAEYEAGIVIGQHLGESSPSKDLQNKNHANILGSKTSQEIIGEIIGKSDKGIIEKIDAIPGVSIGVPEYGSLDGTEKSLIISTHSPMRLDVYDEKGNHTGEISLPVGISADLYTAYENKIPGSKYERTGRDHSPEIYIKVPENGGKYSVVISGTGTGEFTYRIERKRGTEIIEKIEYAGLPVTPLMIASTTVLSDPNFDLTNTSSLSSTSQNLQIDINGDSKIDASIIANSEPDPKIFLGMIKLTLEDLGVKDNRVKELIKKLEKIGKMIEKGKVELVENHTEIVLKQVGHKKLKGLSDADREVVIDSIYNYLAQFK